MIPPVLQSLVSLGSWTAAGRGTPLALIPSQRLYTHFTFLLRVGIFLPCLTYIVDLSEERPLLLFVPQAFLVTWVFPLTILLATTQKIGTRGRMKVLVF